jgi:hypothetical protein
MTETTGAHESPITEITSKNPLLNDKWYTILEWVARVLLPAVATLYTAVGALWGWPNVTQVVGTIVAADAFLGVFLGFAQRSYDSSAAKFDGNIIVMGTPDGGKTFSLELDTNPDDMAEKSQITFKVIPS